VSETTYAAKKTACSFTLWKNRSPILGNLDIELTERCNNDCIHCCICRPENDSSAKNNELSTQDIKDILAEAANLGALSVRFTGGEPLLRHDFQEIYLFARKLGIKVMLFTNARLITPEITELFSRIPPLEKIEITVYGMTKTSYEAVTRKKGSYEEFKRGIDLLISHNILFYVKGALLPPNRHEMDKFEAWVNSISWMDSKPSYAMFFNLRDRRDSQNRNEAIKRLRVSPKECISLINRDGEKYFSGMKNFCSTFMGPHGDMLFSCGAGYKPCVDAYGNLQPCLPLRHPETVYSLKKGSLYDAMTNFFPKIRQMRATNEDYLKRCAKCFLKGLCEQCPAKSWSEHGTLDTPVEYFCEIAHAQAKDLGLLNSNERGWEIKDWKERIAKLR